MKSFRVFHVFRRHSCRDFIAACLCGALLLQSATAVAPGPAWWDTQNVTDPTAAPDDFAVANAGQLKHMARKAMEAMDAELPGGAGETIHALVDPLGTTEETASKPENGLAINQGQLKHVATPFYQRLGLPYPWAGASAVTDNYALVNLGQLKHVFSFELKFRTFGSVTAVTIPTEIEQAALAAWNALGTAKPLGSSADDFDGDGIPNLQEYLMDPDKPLFDTDDYDGDRISNIDEQNSGVLNMLNFADAVWDIDTDGMIEYYDSSWNVHHHGDGLMNYEEMLLGLDLNASTTNARTDGLSDVEVLVWTLNAGAPLEPDPATDAVRLFWEGIDTDWLGDNVGISYSGSFAGWLEVADLNSNQIPDGLEAFRSEVLDAWLWWPQHPSVSIIEYPGLASDPGWQLIDMDGDGAIDSDRDSDGLPDLWEYRYELNLRDSQDKWDDPDGDLLTNWAEFQNGTNPRLADSDGDGYDDKLELDYGGDPLLAGVVPTVPLVMMIVGSGAKDIYTGQTTPALAVKVTQGGQPVKGVSVTFNLTAGTGTLQPAAEAAAMSGLMQSVITDSNGMAAVTYTTGTQEVGTATVTTTAAGVAWTPSFSISIHAVPGVYGASDGSGGGSAGSTSVPPPPRSTAIGATAIAAATGDGFKILVRQKDEPDGFYPYDIVPHYLPPIGMSPTASVGWQDGFDIHSWVRHTRLEFQALPVTGPYREPVVPQGARRYLVLVYQGEYVDPGTPDAPKHVGVLTFQYSNTGARMITLTGSIPEKFVKCDGNAAVTFEPPLAAKSEERVWITLLPIEVMQPKENADGTFGDFVAVSELRATRWRNMFRNGNESLIDDPDQIQIRIPGLRSSQETFRLKLGVTGITGKSSSISKDEDDVVAAWQANDAEVPPLHLVTDSTDDNFSGRAEESTTQKDNYVGDRTHIVSLGATVEIKIEGSESGDFPPIRIPVKGPDGKVEFRVFVLSPNGLGGGNQFDPISNEAKIAHEVYEQIGVSMDWLSTVTAPFPEGLPSSIPLNDVDHELTDDEVRTLVGLLPDPTDKSVIDVYYIPCKIKGVNGTASGVFVPSLKPGKGKYGVILISIGIRNTLVLAHELGHACNLGHRPDISFWLMKDGGVIDTRDIYNSKRFHWQEENIIKSNENAYYVPLH
ncbi:MAG: hypothetical protein R3F13_17075 [Prosthecobacter sp.]